MSVALFVGASNSVFARADEPLNVVIFLVDDLGWQDTEVVFAEARTPQNDRVRTPNLLRLARDGVRFTQAYASPVCSPSRTSLMTGQSAARHHVTQWTREKDGDPSGQGLPVISPPDWKRNGLQPADVTLPALLRKVGYHTIHVGKAHFGARTTAGERPEALGFDISIAGHAPGAPGSYFGENGFGARDPGWAVPELDDYHGLPVHLTDALTIEANRAVAAAVERHQPFFLYFAHYAVHTPLEPHAPYIDEYRSRGFDEKEARYASLIEGVDRSLGALTARLERLGVATRTLVIFTSDNGGLAVEARGRVDYGAGERTYNLPLRAGKGSAYEGGIRVPAIAAFARRDDREPLQQRFSIAAGARCAAPIVIEDLFPTVLELVASETAEAASSVVPADHIVDGRSIVALFDPASERARSESAVRASRPLLTHYPHVWGPRGPGYEPHSSLRVGAEKLIWFPLSQRYELYDLEQDVGETTDRAAERPERVTELKRILVSELQRRDAQFAIARDTREPIAPK